MRQVRRSQGFRQRTLFADDLEAVLGRGFVASERLVTYRQVTEAHLLALARRHKARLATLDRGVVALAGNAASDVLLVPVRN